MGKIFGISDLPVSTITGAVKLGGGMDVPKPEYKVVSNPKTVPALERVPRTDGFVYKNNKVYCSNPFLKMRNGFGKLMKHFSKAKV